MKKKGKNLAKTLHLHKIKSKLITCLYIKHKTIRSEDTIGENLDVDVFLDNPLKS